MWFRINSLLFSRRSIHSGFAVGKSPKVKCWSNILIHSRRICTTKVGTSNCSKDTMGPHLSLQNTSTWKSNLFSLSSSNLFISCVVSNGQTTIQPGSNTGQIQYLCDSFICNEDIRRRSLISEKPIIRCSEFMGCEYRVSTVEWVFGNELYYRARYVNAMLYSDVDYVSGIVESFICFVVYLSYNCLHQLFIFILIDLVLDRVNINL